ncbi:unnamed protein product [Protopolystoma xenopodis]|uniref:Uncharacterized protein n=1 Tax=Protopolystoma xenopodis TaxID=117903 RepID=A0A3S5BV49_9PLAT|nr:unnamed protein product [Protopolystoma xenopodis]
MPPWQPNYPGKDINIDDAPYFDDDNAEFGLEANDPDDWIGELTTDIDILDNIHSYFAC